jgi:hypothetical protein
MMKKIIKDLDLLLSFSSLLLVILLFLFLKPVFAASTTTEVSVIVNQVISISSLGSVTLNVTPTSNGVQTANSDIVSISTSDTNGYNLSISDSSNISNALTYSSYSIPATTYTTSSPGILNANYWGFCVNDLSTFTGFCPNAPFTNQTINSSLKFAAVPLLSNAVQVKTTHTTASNDTTTFWYGASIDTSQPSGTYSGTVVYTAYNNV